MYRKIGTVGYRNCFVGSAVAQHKDSPETQKKDAIGKSNFGTEKEVLDLACLNANGHTTTADNVLCLESLMVECHSKVKEGHGKSQANIYQTKFGYNKVKVESGTEPALTKRGRGAIDLTNEDEPPAKLLKSRDVHNMDATQLSQEIEDITSTLRSLNLRRQFALQAIGEPGAPRLSLSAHFEEMSVVDLKIVVEGLDKEIVCWKKKKWCAEALTTWKEE